MNMLSITLEHSLGALGLDLSLEVGARVLALVGPNGAGKTTLLRAVLGAVRPRSGRVTLGGAVLLDTAAGIDAPMEARRLGWVPQGYALFPHMSALENVAFALRGREARARAAALLQRLGVGHVGARRPGQLSGGEAQRVALARALAIEPRALLLDEPLAALDPDVRRATRDALREQLRALALPTLLVTHAAEDLVAFDADVAVLEGGRIVARGRWDEVAAQASTPFQRELFRGLGSAQAS